MTIHDQETTIRERKFVIKAILETMQAMSDDVRPCFGCMATGAVYFACMIAKKHLGLSKEDVLQTVANVWEDLNSAKNTMGDMALN
jgi:hypothetical protein